MEDGCVVDGDGMDEWDLSETVVDVVMCPKGLGVMNGLIYTASRQRAAQQRDLRTVSAGDFKG
jgi:hypothetical protein